MFKKIIGKLFKSEAEKAAERAAKEEEYFKRTSNKHYRPEDNKPKFSDDYFKSVDDDQPEKPKEQPKAQPTSEAKADRQKTTEQQAKSKQEKDKQKKTRRTTTMSNGVTIIDERDANLTGRKIFAPGEGEYVEYTEV